MKASSPEMNDGEYLEGGSPMRVILVQAHVIVI